MTLTNYFRKYHAPMENKRILSAYNKPMLWKTFNTNYLLISLGGIWTGLSTNLCNDRNTRFTPL